MQVLENMRMDSEGICAIEKIQTSEIEKTIRMVSVAVITGTLLFFLINMMSNGLQINSYFISDWQDTFMDYFNMLECVRKGDPYYAYANYPAVVFLIIKIIFQFTPESEVVSFPTVREEAFSLRSNMTAMLPFVVLCLICLISIAASARWMLRKYRRSTVDLATYAVLLSGPMLFLLERGNLLLLSFACLMGFVALYRSDRSWIRVVACCLISLSASMKLYPAIFALMLLSEKRYKEFGITVVVGLVLLICPFFIFGGVEAIVKMLQGFKMSGEFANSAGFGSNYSLNNLLGVIGALGGMKLSVSSTCVSVAALVFSITIFGVSRLRWVKVFACALACVWTPSFSYTYTLIMFIPVILVFYEDADDTDTFGKIAIILLSLTLVMLVSPEVIASDRLALYGWCLAINVLIFVLSTIIFLSQISCFVSRQGERLKH